jgi:hypothetical protein
MIKTVYCTARRASSRTTNKIKIGRSSVMTAATKKRRQRQKDYERVQAQMADSQKRLFGLSQKSLGDAVASKKAI